MVHGTEITDTLEVCFETSPNQDGDDCEKCKIVYYNDTESVIQ